MTTLADANLFIRFLTKDSPEQQRKAATLFSQVLHRKHILVVRPEVIAEVLFVLHSPRSYNYLRNEIVELLLPLLRLAGTRLVDRTAVEQALVTYATIKLDFVDVLLIALARVGKVKSSFDENFKDIEGVQWVQP